ncbi:MAG: EAL domain-containing protein, partial [Acidimicrobiales bacterium]
CRRLGMSVNFSARQFSQPDLLEQIATVLGERGLDPRGFSMEITETVLVRDPALAAVRLQQLRDLGVRLAIDDFGTGYSSLSYLRRFPIDMLKIDKAFVDGIGKGREDTALAHAIVKLSHTLQLHTVAEGIEQAEQAAHLASLGCQDGQGFLFARPLDSEAMTELLAKSLADGGFYLPVAQNLEAAVGT